MKIPALILASTIASLASAQEETGPPPDAMPDPHHEAHRLLEAMAGDWRCSFEEGPVPGIPGLEEAVRSEGTERAELICDGLWLKSTVRGAYGGRPFEGLWLAGYDPFEETYVGLWVDSGQPEHGATRFEGSYDEASRTLTWTADTPRGPVRSTYVLEGPDRAVETCYMTGPGGDEVQCMEIVRTRADLPPATEASAPAPADLPAPKRRLLADAGVWNATVESTPPGGEPVTDRGTERVTPLCDGHWMWSDFEGELMGAPFEGHGLYGWDASRGEYVSYWIDTMSATLTETAGDFDGEGTLTLAGTCRDPFGAEMEIRQAVTSADDGARACDMTFASPAGTHRMRIAYERASED